MTGKVDATGYYVFFSFRQTLEGKAPFAMGVASVPQTCRTTAKPLRVSLLTSQLNGGRSERKTLYF